MTSAGFSRWIDDATGFECAACRLAGSEWWLGSVYVPASHPLAITGNHTYRFHMYFPAGWSLTDVQAECAHLAGLLATYSGQ